MHSFCRTCLAKLETKPSIKGRKYHVSHNKELSKLVSLIMSAEVSKKDGYPKFLCQLCFQKFQNFKEFRSLCLKSKRTLDKILDATDSEPENPTENVAKKELSGDEKETQKYKQVHQQEQIGLNEKTIDDKNLISSVIVSTDELKEFKEEMEIASVSTCEDNGDLKDTFEYKDCTDDTPEETLNNVKQTKYTENRTTSDLFPGNETESSVDEFVHVKRKKIIKTSAEKIPKKDNKQHKDKQPPDSANTAEKRVMIQCTQCTRRYLSQENLEAHIRTHQGLKEFACKMCDRAYDKVCRLKVHIDTKHRPQIEEFTCSFEGCDEKFTRTDSYRAHFRIKHTESKDPRMKYVCEDCWRIFQNITNFREHRYKHFPKELYPYHCEQCGKRYTSQRVFKEHQQRHAVIKKFECKFCGMKKTTSGDLKLHLNHHTKEKQYPCQLCTRVFYSTDNLRTHVIGLHNGKRRFACGYCDQSFSKADTLKDHEMRHTREKLHVCQICGKRFLQTHALRRHLNLHSKTDEKLAPKQQKLQQEIFLQQSQTSADVNEISTVCQKYEQVDQEEEIRINEKAMNSSDWFKSEEYGDKNLLITKFTTLAKKIPKKDDKQHQDKQPPDSANTAEKRVMIQCKICDRAFDKACRLKVHVDTKHRPEIEKFTCSFDDCEKKFTRTDSYRAHFRLKHTENQPPRMTYICEDCGRIFHNITHYREHRYKHFPKELYPYHCEQCGKLYTSHRTYKEHQLRHAGIKKFECKFCGLKKTTLKELNVHLNFHTKEKQFPCQLCTRVYYSSGNLCEHVRVVHKGIRKYACSYCDQSFRRADTLKDHEMRHTGGKVHECQICGKRFLQALALGRHLKMHNKSDEKLAAKHQKLQQEIFLQQPQTFPDVNETSTVCLI